MRISVLVVFVAAALALAASACKREQATSGIDVEAGENEAPDGRLLQAMPVPEDWVAVSVQTPNGATVSLGVPGDWLEARLPNESTLAVRAAPSGPAAGTKATIVATAFEGDRAALAEYMRTRLKSFAAIKNEESTRVGTIDTHELAASWTTPVGNRETVQLLIATGKEAIAITCEIAPGQFDNLSGLCEEIFATLSMKGAKSLR
jgi:hypothetical protein